MFHPVDRPMERGWVGRVDGDHVVHLAAQTLQSFFTGGGSAREHAVYPLAAVRLLAPVLHPPSIRIFEDERSFAFGNPASIRGPEAELAPPRSELGLIVRPAALVGTEGALAGFTAAADWRAPGVPPPKDRDFALGLGPMVVTRDELPADSLEVVLRIDGDERLSTRVDAFDWNAARDFAADGTTLYPGDLLLGPPAASLAGLDPSHAVEIELDRIGVLRQSVAARR
jgi:hypothetical protein